MWKSRSDDCLNWLALAPAEGFPHAVSGARAGEPQSGAGHQEQAAAPAGEDDDGARQAGERRSFVTDHRWHQRGKEKTYDSETLLSSFTRGTKM